MIQVGAGNLFNAAFERGLMGLKLGETYNLNVTFAEDDADPDVAGKTTNCVALNLGWTSILQSHLVQRF